MNKWELNWLKKWFEGEIVCRNPKCLVCVPLKRSFKRFMIQLKGGVVM